MLEMDALERQLADESLRIVGAARPVDDLAIFEAVSATNRQRESGFTLFSALKLAAASVIVAVFGGFLLAGILTQPEGNEGVPGTLTGSPSPLAIDEDRSSSAAQDVEPSKHGIQLDGLPSSLVTEEVEPGVRRVVSDGRLDLTQALLPDREIASTVVAPDGSAWMFGPESHYRLGTQGGVREWPVRRPNDAGFAPNGDIWAAYPGVIHVFDGTAWTTRTVEVNADRIEFAADGTPWAQIWDVDKQAAVVGWFRPHGAAFVPAREEVAQTGDVDEEPDGAAFVPSSVAEVGLATGGAWSKRNDGTLELYRWARGEWESVSSPPGYGMLEIGPDGTVWMVRCPDAGCWGPFGNREAATFARLDGGEWLESARPETGLTVWGIERVASDGALWGPASPRRDDICSGIVRFDGVESARWLDGHCIEAIEIGPDGNAWVQAFKRSTLEDTGSTDDGPVETYVIRPVETE